MCRSVHVRLSHEERKEVTRWTGILIPAYASIAVCILAAMFFLQALRNGEMIVAADSAPAHTAAR